MDCGSAPVFAGVKVDPYNGLVMSFKHLKVFPAAALMWKQQWSAIYYATKGWFGVMFPSFCSFHHAIPQSKWSAVWKEHYGWSFHVFH